jgi:hypothetical protein
MEWENKLNQKIPGLLHSPARATLKKDIFAKNWNKKVVILIQIIALLGRKMILTDFQDKFKKFKFKK